MSTKDDWKTFGKNVGGTFKKLGKSIVKSAKVGIDKLEEDEDAPKSDEPTGLMESWSEVGHGFGETGKSLGKAITSTAKTVVDDEEDKDKPIDVVAEEKAEDEKKD